MNVAIFGATSTIAEHVGRIFAAQGASLLLVARDERRLAALRDSLMTLGATAVTVEVADLQSTDVAALTMSVLQGAQPLKCAVLAFGVLGTIEQHEAEPASAAALVEINTAATVACALEVAKILERQRSGTLCILGSVAGDRGRRSNYVYGASKAALAVFCDGLRSRLRRSGVNVLLVKPGPVKSAMTAGMRGYGRFAEPATVARDIVSAINRGAGLIYTPRMWRPLSWAIRLVPARLLELAEQRVR